MPVISQYPLPLKAAHPAEPIGPRWKVYYEMEPDYSVTASPVFGDGGRDTNLNADVKVRRWLFDYDTLTEAEGIILDAHAEEARYNSEVGSAYGFNYRDWRTDVLHSAVHYERFERVGHSRLWLQSRRVILCKRP